MSENRALIRATLVSQVVAILAKYYELDADVALARFYDSKTALAFADDETGLYGHSALNIACQCIAERDKTVELSRL